MFAASKTDSASTGGYQISRSLRFNSADSAYLNRTPAGAGNRRTFTISAWVKRAALGTLQYLWEGGSPDGQTTRLLCRFNTDDTLRVATGSTIVFNTTQVFRDPSSWYHIVVAIDTPNATQASRARLYVNGSEVTTFSSASYFGSNDDTGWNMAQAHSIGRSHVDSAGYLSAYLTEFYNVDGTALTPSSFGETNAQTGVWGPKAYSGSYGTNGFYLNFSDNSNTTAATLGKDYSGNGNNWTPNNFSVTAGVGNDSMVDVPTPYGVDTGVGGTVRGNYSTLNPLNTAYTDKTFSDGNLNVTGSTTNQVGGHSTMQIPTTGQWYAECVMTAFGSGSPFIGVNGGTTTLGAGGASYRTDGTKELNGTGSSYGATWTTNDVIGIAVDTGAGSITFYKNGTSQGVAYTTLNTNFTNGLFFSCQGAAGTTTFVYNFGQRPFAYTAPSGFKALCTQNLPTPTIGATTATQAGKFFNPILYTGTGSNLAVTGVGFQPDWIWTKSRSAVDNHVVVDAVRGIGNILIPNSTNAESTYNAFNSFDSDGFTKSSLESVNGRTYVAWNWKANGSGSSNTSGSITSTVSANTTSGFSVVTYTGNATSTQTVGHGIGIAPSMVIVKSRSAAEYWYVWAKALNDNNKYLFLNTNGTGGSSVNIWQNTAPTSTVFSLGNDAGTNGSGTTYVAYCFAEVAGYSKFGSYTGNGSADGPFVYTGFRPAFILIKGSSDADRAWVMLDVKRNTYNAMNANLYANASDAEATDTRADANSNGFKIRGTGTWINNSGSTYIYMAFAESPFKYSLAR
jgi:hypothetical protein